MLIIHLHSNYQRGFGSNYINLLIIVLGIVVIYILLVCWLYLHSDRYNLDNPWRLIFLIGRQVRGIRKWCRNWVGCVIVHFVNGNGNRIWNWHLIYYMGSISNGRVSGQLVVFRSWVYTCYGIYCTVRIIGRKRWWENIWCYCSSILYGSA